jgi:hypothetical protein
LDHQEPTAKPRKGEFWRKHNSLALLVGKNEVADFEKHYADHGISVDHRETASGDMEPVITRREQFEAMLASRGMHDRS